MTGWLVDSDKEVSGSQTLFTVIYCIAISHKFSVATSAPVSYQKVLVVQRT